MRMARLIMTAKLAGSAFVNHTSNLVQIAIKHIDGLPPYGQPTATVDPRSPTADRGDRSGRPGIIQTNRNSSEGVDIEGKIRIIIDSNVVVGALARRPDGARPAKCDSPSAGHSRELAHEAIQQTVIILGRHLLPPISFFWRPQRPSRTLGRWTAPQDSPKIPGVRASDGGGNRSD